MFANVLLDTEKEAFIKLLLYLSRIDGEISQEELSNIQQCCLELEVDLSHIFHGESQIMLQLDEILQQITHPISKRAVLLELVNFAHADKTYAAAEQQGIRSIAAALGVSEIKVHEIEQWVQEGITWADRGLKIINNEE